MDDPALLRKDKKKKVEYEREADLEWGGGLAQRRAAEERAQAMEEEAAKPFGRSGCVGQPMGGVIRDVCGG